ncbi:MAG TPA: cytochrome c [Pyrinomonadaceae bacterium]|nr:cytochrome c [Pyrinomonadaceae bacterium]
MTFVKSILMLSSIFWLFFGCSNLGTSNQTLDAVPPRNTATVNTPAKTPMPEVANPIEAGKTLYTRNCANCHKEDGSGGKVVIEGRTLNPDNLTSDKIKGFSDEKITKYVTDGIEDEGMPSFKDKLSPEEIRMVVTYVRRELQKVPAK